MTTFQSKSSLTPSRLQHRTMTLSQSNSKLIYDGGDASMFVRTDSTLNKLQVNSLKQSLLSSIKGDLSFIQLPNMKLLNQIDYKRELMSIVICSQNPESVKYVNTFMKNQQHQQSFDVIFKCDTQEAFSKLNRIQNPRLKLVTLDWDEVESTIEDIYRNYYKRFVEFKGESKVKNKHYDFKDKDIVLNIYYPQSFTDILPSIQLLEKRGSKSFKSIHFVKYSNYTEIIKRDVIRNKTKKAMTKMLTQSHAQMEAKKPQVTAMKEIAEIGNADKNIILATDRDVKYLEEIIRDRANYEIVVLNGEKEREMFFRGVLKCYKDPSEEDPVITCHRLILLISEDEESLIGYAQELTEVDQTVGVATYSTMSSLTGELFLIGENSNSQGLLICSEHDWRDYQDLITSKEIKNVTMVVLSENDNYDYQTFVSTTVSGEDELCQYLESVIEQRQEYYDPVRGIDGERIHIYFQEKDKGLRQFVEQGILGKKRLQAHSYETVNDLLGYVEQTISVDGVLIVCSPQNVGSVAHRVKDQKNVKLIVYGDQKQAGYNTQIINYCETREALLNFLLNIPGNESIDGSLSDLLYNPTTPTLPLVKQQQLDPRLLLPPFQNKPLVYIRMPNKLQNQDSLIFQQRMKKHLGVDLFMGIYERIEDIRNLTFMEEPLSFIIGTTSDMKWIEKFTQSEKNNRFQVLIYTEEPEKGRRLLKGDAVKLLASRFEDIENYILGRIEGYQTALYGPMVEYQYGNFPVNQNNTVVVYYPTGNQKLRLELMRNRDKSKFLSMAMLIPYQNLNELKKSLGTYSKTTKILIYANEMPTTGYQSIIQTMLREYMNQNFAIVTNRQQRSIASYCKYSSNRTKKCVQWIRNIPVSKPPKTRVSLNRNSKLGALVPQPTLRPVEIAIDKKDPSLFEARDINMWNTGTANIRYNLVSSNQDILSLENKAVIDNTKKYMIVMSSENVQSHLNTFKNSCVKLIVQNNGNSAGSHPKHQSILFEGSPQRINSFIVNPFRDQIEYPSEFYYRNIKVLVNSSLMTPEEKSSLSSQGMSIHTYNSHSQLSDLIKSQNYDLICCRNGDPVNPVNQRVILSNTSNLTFEQRIPYEFVGNQEDARKYLSILSFLKRVDLRQFHDQFQGRRAITVKGILKNKLFERNYTLLNRPNSPKLDIVLDQGPTGYSLRTNRMSDPILSPSQQHLQYLIQSLPNYNQSRFRNAKLSTKPCFLFDSKSLLKETQIAFPHLNSNIKYQNFQTQDQLHKLLDYSRSSPSFVFTSTQPQLRQHNCEVVFTNGNPSNQDIVTASPNTIKRIVNSLKIDPTLQSRVRAETLILVPESMSAGQFQFLGQNLEQSSNGLLQFQLYSSPQSIGNIACTHLYIITSEELYPRVLSKLPALTSCHSKRIIIKVQEETLSHKNLYKTKHIEFITDNETELCEFVLTLENHSSYHIDGREFFVLPNYYQTRLDQNQQVQKNIKLYSDIYDLESILKDLPGDSRKYVVLNRFSNPPEGENVRVFFEGSARMAPSDSLSQLTPSRIMRMVKVDEPSRRSIHNALSDIQFSYTLNRPNSSKSLKDEKVGAQVSRQDHYVQQNYKSFAEARLFNQERQKYIIVEGDPQLRSYHNEYYSVRSTPQAIQEYIFQPINFPQKFTKHPHATIVPYRDEDELKILIRKFSADPYVKITVQRYTRFEQYQIPPVPASVRPALVEYMENELNKPQRYNIPDFNSEYYPSTHQVYSSEVTQNYNQYQVDSTKQYYSRSSPAQYYDTIEEYTNKASSISHLQSSDSLKEKTSMKKLLTDKSTIYYKHPNHRFIPTHFSTKSIEFIPYYSPQELLQNLNAFNSKPNIIIIEEDRDIITIQNSLNLLDGYSFLRVLRSDFNDFGSLPNTQTVMLETFKQESVIDWIEENIPDSISVLSRRPSGEIANGGLSLIKKNSNDFSQLSTNIY